MGLATCVLRIGVSSTCSFERLKVNLRQRVGGYSYLQFESVHDMGIKDQRPPEKLIHQVIWDMMISPSAYTVKRGNVFFTLMSSCTGSRVNISYSTHTPYSLLPATTIAWHRLPFDLHLSDRAALQRRVEEPVALP